MPRQPIELIYLEWVDAAANQGWHNLDSIRDDATVLLIQSVGWVIRETDQAITLAAHMHKDIPENGAVRQATDPLTIPKAAITMRRMLRKR